MRAHERRLHDSSGLLPGLPCNIPPPGSTTGTCGYVPPGGDGSADGATTDGGTFPDSGTMPAGGRVFASHWHEYWFSNGPAPLPTIATWTSAKLDPPLVSLADFDTTFVKGKALFDWLNLQGALTPQGQMSLREGRHNVDAVDGAKARSWITMLNSNEANAIAHQYVTVNAPIGVPEDQQCGRAVFSDLHVSADINNVIGADFPDGCKTDDLTPQEKALLFMLFDLSSCVQDDNVAPRPPR